MSPNLEVNDAVIVSRLIQPERNGLSVAAARAILRIAFAPQDKGRMRELAGKARAGTLTSSEQAELDSYERVGHFLGLLHSKARRSLKKHAARST